MGLLANTSKSNLLRKGPDVYSAFTHPAAKLHVTRKKKKKKCSASFLFKLGSVPFASCGQNENIKVVLVHAVECDSVESLSF